MTNFYKEFWEVANMDEAWWKIVNGPPKPEEVQQTFELLLDGIPRGGTVLEIGAGVGRIMRVMSPHFERVWGVDISESMVAMSKDFLKDFPNCVVKFSDGYKLPVADAAFDLVYSCITFQHMPDLGCVRSNVEEIFRVLKPGGMCRVQTIKGQPYRGEFGKNGFGGWYFEREEDFRGEFLRCGFETAVRVVPIVNSPVSAIWLTGKKP